MFENALLIQPVLFLHLIKQLGWRETYKSLAGCSLCVLAGAMLLLRDFPEKYGLLPDAQTPVSPEVAAAAAAAAATAISQGTDGDACDPGTDPDAAEVDDFLMGGGDEAAKKEDDWTYKQAVATQ